MVSLHESTSFCKRCIEAVQLLREGESQLLGALFPRRCMVCNLQSADWLCEGCMRRLSEDAKPTVEVIGRMPCLWFFPYADDRVAKFIHGLKYGGMSGIAGLFVRAVRQSGAADIVREFLGNAPILIPVPTSKPHLKERGYNQAEVIANEWARAFHGSVWPRALRHVGRAVQAGSSREARLRQAAEAFTWRGKGMPNGSGTRIIVDDVCTTGSTLEACARCLTENVSGEVRAIVMAKSV